jgi:hypothetical protein
MNISHSRLLFFILNLFLWGLYGCAPVSRPSVDAVTVPQAQGEALVRRLNDRYDDTAGICADGRPAYYCNGVLVQGVRHSATEHFWNADAVGQRNNTMSFSYIRRDEATTNLYLPYGYIIRELRVPADQPMVVRCFYPTNGSTNDMVNDGCGGSSLGYDGPCAAQGVTTAQGWVDHYTAHGATRSCSFAASAQAFKTGVDAKVLYRWSQFNEAVLAVWPQNIPERLPIEAFFWVSNRLYPPGRPYISSKLGTFRQSSIR